MASRITLNRSKNLKLEEFFDMFSSKSSNWSLKPLCIWAPHMLLYCFDLKQIVMILPWKDSTSYKKKQKFLRRFVRWFLWKNPLKLSSEISPKVKKLFSNAFESLSFNLFLRKFKIFLAFNFMFLSKSTFTLTNIIQTNLS